MRFEKLGNTGLVVSEVCLGAMTFSDGQGMWAAVGRLEQPAVNELMRIAIDRGVNFFDTANVYSNGLSETMTGAGLKQLGISRDQFVLATKVRGRMGDGPNQSGLSRAHILAAVDASLKRLQLDYIDLYQIHGPDPLTPFEETLDALDMCVRAGKVRYIGLCNLAAWQITKCLWIADKRNLARFESIQAYYSIAGRDLEREIVPLARDQRLAILPWSPLAGGFLSGKYSREQQAPADSRRNSFDFPPIDRERAYGIIDVMRPIAEARGVSVAQVALAWVLQQPQVTSVIIGAKTPAQLNDNLDAVDLTLSETEVAALNQVSALPSEYPGWYFDITSDDRLAAPKS